jgi:hypothetical protein
MLKAGTMKCDVILIFTKQTNDSELELAENQVSLFRKYHDRPLSSGRKTICYALQMGDSGLSETAQQIAPARPAAAMTVLNNVPDLKDAGSVGIYILCHTADMRATAAMTATYIYDKVIRAKRGNVRKISVACCNAADKKSSNKGIIKDFCTGLAAAAQNSNGSTEPNPPLLDGMMVCGFNTTITTFDVDSNFMKGGGATDLYANAAEYRHMAAQTGRVQATVVQHHATRTISFTHERVDDAVAAASLAAFETELDCLLRTTWDTKKGEIVKKLKGPTSRDCTSLAQLNLDELCLSRPGELARSVGAKDVANFTTALRTALSTGLFDASLRQWPATDNTALRLKQSLETYVKMKKVLKYHADAKSFSETTLDDYTDNRGLGDMLKFVSKGGKQWAAEFFP